MRDDIREWLLSAVMVAAALYLLRAYAHHGQWTFTLEFVRAWLGGA